MALTYNGVSFTYPNVITHVMGPVKDPSGSDQLFTEIHLKARSLIFADSTRNTFLVPTNTTDMGRGTFPSSATVARIRHLLTAPRRPLYYDVSSLPGVSSPAGGNIGVINLPTGRDDNNGPWPDEDAFSIVQTTPNCFEVTWGCKVWLRDCQDVSIATGSSTTAAPPSGPLSLRWEDSLTWDKYWKATYSRKGTLIISSLDPVSIDSYRRNTIAPICPMGFRRTKAHYTVDRTGLRCDFHFEDEQIIFAPPYPATDMDITQSETLPLTNGMRHGEVNIHMKGVIDGNIIDMSMWCLTVLQARVRSANPLGLGNGLVVGEALLKTRETETSIECSASAKYRVPPLAKQLNLGVGGLAKKGAWDLGAGLLGAGAGFLVAGPLGAVSGFAVGGLGGAAVDKLKGLFGMGGGGGPGLLGAFVPVLAGLAGGARGNVLGLPEFPWIGAGTTLPNPPSKITGLAEWCNAATSVVAPDDGVLLAPAVQLMAAILKDPCGEQAVVTEMVNMGSGGRGGAAPPPPGPPNINGPIVTAALADFAAEKKAEIQQQYSNTGLFFYDGQPGCYDQWVCLSEYHDENGKIVLPTCNHNGDNIAVRYSSDMLVLRRRWAARRLGAPPNLPPKDSTDPNMVYVGGMIAPRELRVGADGVSVEYEVQGVYEYMALNPSRVDKTAMIPPFLASSQLTKEAGWLTLYEDNGGPGQQTGSSGFTASVGLGASGPSPLGYGVYPGTTPF